MIDTLAAYFAYPFVRYALIVGVLIALSSSLLGVTLVLNAFRLSEMDYHMSRLAQLRLQRFWTLEIIWQSSCRLPF